MKNNYISLFKIIAFLSAIAISFILFVALEEYFATQKNFQKEIDNHMKMGALGVQEIVSNQFRRTYDIFNKTINSDLKKLKDARDYFETLQDSLTPIQKLLNQETIFGEYDIYLFDEKHKIYKSSLKTKNIYKIFRNATFDKIADKGLEVSISTPVYNLFSNDIRRYLFTKSKNKEFFIQISHNYNLIPQLKRQLEIFKKNFEDIVSIKIFVISDNLAKSILDKTKIISFLDLKNQIIKDLEENYLENSSKLKYKIDLKEKSAHLYKELDLGLGDKSRVLLNIDFDVSNHILQRDKELFKLLIIILFSLILVFIIMVVIKSLVIDNIYRIIETLNKNETPNSKGIKIQEIEVLIKTLKEYKNELHKRNKELESLASIDNMTGCLNRRVFNEKLDEYFYQYQRYNRRFGLIIFDIDNFKMINDKFGHRRGDIVLAELSSRIKKHIRKSDLFFRIGGEEFAILVSSDDEKEVIEFAKKIRKIVEEKLFDGNLKVTISVGVGVLNGDKDSISLFNRIDRYTYISKQNGKNRVTSIFDQTKISNK
jgi:diguanylate cyclase (GGDEF)-like protein